MNEQKQLTRQQLTRLYGIATYESRRSAKRYCRQHGLGGDAAALDAQLALIDAEIVAEAERIHAASQVATERSEERDRWERAVELIYHALAGEWPEIVREVAGDPHFVAVWNELTGGPDSALAQDLIGAKVIDDDWQEALANAEQSGSAEVYWGHDDVDDLTRDIIGIAATLDVDASKTALERELMARATPEGRYSACDVYTRDGSISHMIHFDDKADAMAYARLQNDGCNGTEAFRTNVIDSKD